MAMSFLDKGAEIGLQLKNKNKNKKNQLNPALWWATYNGSHIMRVGLKDKCHPGKEQDCYGESS